MPSWPALFIAALAVWLVLKGSAATMPSWVQKARLVGITFFLYCGFLYLLKWDPLWKSMPSVDFENRSRAEGFLILISTLVWFIATLRMLFRRLRLPSLPVSSDGFENRASRQENLWPFIKKVAIFHYFFTRR
jgi:predicted membrane channel-forming protein YqfA (hemolysin III family)